MAEPKGVGIGEVEHHLSHGRYPRDLMQRLNSTDQMRFREAMVKKEEIEQDEDDEEEEIELNLGLSLGGRFGVDPPKQSSNNNNKLLRSSSMIAGLSTTTFLREDDAAAAAAAATTSVVFPLIRTSSLPMESEEEWRKRKELQSLRRMEAKRKRSVKQKNIKLGKERASLERNSVEEDGGGGLPGFLKQQQQQQVMFGNGFAPPAVVTTPFGMPNWASSAHRGSVGSSGGLDESNSILAAAAVGGGQGYLPPSSQGSVGSHGSSSSAISEFESLRPVQGLGNCNEARSPSSVQSVPEQKPIATSASTNTKTVKAEEAENPSKKPRINENGIRESGMKVMEEMPCVSTKGDGPNGRRIEGFLYKYKKGEEVRIVCVCHGSFLTPAEFVKHAGGGDVAHPLRQIVVTPSPSFL